MTEEWRDYALAQVDRFRYRRDYEDLEVEALVGAWLGWEAGLRKGIEPGAAARVGARSAIGTYLKWARRKKRCWDGDSSLTEWGEDGQRAKAYDFSPHVVERLYWRDLIRRTLAGEERELVEAECLQGEERKEIAVQWGWHYSHVSRLFNAAKTRLRRAAKAEAQ